MSPELDGAGNSPWILWSTRESIESEIPSIMAIIETLIAIPLYWIIAVHFETYALLLMGVVVAPLVLLRSDESVKLGVKWFIQWEKYWVGSTKFEELEAEDQLLPRVVGLLAAISGAALSCITIWWTFDLKDWGVLSVVIFFLLASVLSGGTVVGMVVGIVSVAEFVVFKIVKFVAVFFAVAGSIWAHVIVFEYSIGLFEVIFLFPAAGIGAVVGIPFVLAVVPIFLFGFALGVFVVSIFVRFFATCCHLVSGARRLPGNFRRLTVCTSPLQEPELVPGLPQLETQFSLSSVVAELTSTIGAVPDALIPGWQKRRLRVLRNQNAPHSLGFIIWPIASVLWFVPAWLYRITLKSTTWFWWPLAFLMGDPKRFADPNRFRRKVIETLWARSSIAVALFVVGSFLFVNFIVSGLAFETNPLLTVFGYFLLVNWTFVPWQALAIILAVLSILIVFWLDDTVGDYREAQLNGDSALLSAAKRNLNWIERLLRVRLVLTVIFWLIIGGHTSIYFNSVKCWTTLPKNIEVWAVWIYRDRMPASDCTIFKSEILSLHAMK